MTSGCSVSCWIAPGMLSPSSGSEFWSPGDHEQLTRLEAAVDAVVVVDVTRLAGRDVVGPEADLVVVAAAVPVLGPVEHWRRRVRDEEVHGLAADQDRDVPVALGREPQDVDFVRRVEGRRDQVPGHVLPLEELERAHLVVRDRVLREHDHPELPRERAEAERVVAIPQCARRRHDAPLLFKSFPVATPVFEGAMKAYGYNAGGRRSARPRGSCRGAGPRPVGRLGVVQRVELVHEQHIGPTRWITSATFFACRRNWSSTPGFARCVAAGRRTVGSARR